MRKPLFTVITVSDRCSAGLMKDTAGPAVTETLRRRWTDAAIYELLVPDEEEQIAARLLEACEARSQLILTVGGTGLGLRDRTPEATRHVIEREASGLAEAMRARGAESYPYAWLSRAIAGTRGETLILNLPGSRKGAVESLEAVLDLLAHALELLGGANSHPARHLA